MILTPDQQRVKTLLAETITLLCKNGLSFKSEFSIEALVGITLDNSDVILLSIKETIRNNLLPSLVAEKSGANQTKLIRDSTGSQCEEVGQPCGEKSVGARKVKNSACPEISKDDSSQLFSEHPNEEVDAPPMVIESSEDENDSNSCIPPTTSIESESFLVDNQSNSPGLRRRKKLKTRNVSFDDIPATVTRDDSMDEMVRSYENDMMSESYQQDNDSLAAINQGPHTVKGEQLDYDTFSDFSEQAKASLSYPEMKIKQEMSNQDGNSETGYYDYNMAAEASSHQLFASSSNNFIFQDSPLLASGGGGSSNFRSQQSLGIPSSQRSERKKASSHQQTKHLQGRNHAAHSKVNDHSLSIVSLRSSEGSTTFEPGREEIRCRECQEVFPVIEAYLHHLSVHRRVTVGGGEGEARQFYKYPCPCCEKSFSSHTNFRGHWSKHTGIKEFVCTYCGVEYTYKQMLKDHILQRHQIAQLTLDDAGNIEQYQ